MEVSEQDRLHEPQAHEDGHEALESDDQNLNRRFLC